ncbi:MlaD family protein [Sulfurospirillum arcachonense]|uniref:MlaD family protein n=1 Tax=Sulfurospirillum arcachonense TaxID=57666 RepID=UPI00046936CF|nr:MlaD family protein [Sulfurospirillum arcachonense]
MENRVSYIMIGLFVFILGFSTIGFILWLGKYAQTEVYNHYKVVTQQSVSGLNVKAPVKLRGVSVGEVKDIYINTENSEEVIVLIKVKEETPIKEDSYALINLQGITGLSYIELDGGTNESPLLKTGKNHNSYGVIKTKDSMIERVDKTLQVIGKKTERMLDKTDKVMSKTNLKNLEKILENFAKVTDSLNKTLETINSKNDELDKILSSAHDFEIAFISAADEVKKMASVLGKSGHSTLVSMQEAALTTSRVMNAVDTKLKQGVLDVDVIVRENLLPFQNDLNDLRTLIIESKELVSELRDSPSDILFKETDVELAPSEENQR